jgi:predicted Zn-dependent protease
VELTATELHRVRAAQGWLELGNPDEAGAELEALPAGARKHPAVLEIRWNILARSKSWADCVEVAQALTHRAPEHPTSWVNLAYALHELRRTNEAHQTLLKVIDRFPKEWILPYNLACYCCQMGDLTGARDWLAQSMKLGDRKAIKAQALEDPDLAPLWES